ncbi:MAG: isochorismatase family protein [Negativicutes bacterium]|nr:isochorismatase family protein [Negativicutes bacterium]
MMIERAEVSTSLLLVIDMQDKLLQAIDGKEVILQQTERMMKYANTLEIPIIVTEQYKKGLGESNQKIQAEAIDNQVFEKISFSAFDTEEIANSIKTYNPKTIVICGVEAHICVCQTALAALVEGYDVRVISDAVGSRTEFNKQIGMKRLENAGIIIDSTESILYEWLKMAGTPEFKKILPLVK